MISKLINQLKDSLSVLECQDGRSLDVAEKLGTLGDLYCSGDMYADAEQCYWRALELKQQHFGPIDITVAFGLQALAEFYELVGQNSRAHLLYDSIVTILNELPTRERLSAIDIIERAAGFYRTQRLTAGVARLTRLIDKFRSAEEVCKKTA